jgi:hypothetical protein
MTALSENICSIGVSCISTLTFVARLETPCSKSGILYIIKIKMLAYSKDEQEIRGCLEVLYAILTYILVQFSVL